MNRIDRVTAILIQLQSKKIVKAQEIADRFEISLRTVYRDIRTLEEAGVPLIGEAGVGYSIMDGYRLPPVMFTKEEATAFLLAEKIVENYTDAENSAQYKSALYKIRAVLRSAEKSYLENVENKISVFKSRYEPTPSVSNHSLQDILNAIHEKRLIEISYLNPYAGEATTRTIEPVGTYLKSNHWYLIAFCRLKNDYRNFRIDRINQLKLSQNTFIREHPSLDQYVSRVSNEVQFKTIVIRVDKETARYIVMQKYYYGFVSEIEVDDQVEMTFLSTSIEGFSRWYLMLAPDAQIIEPPELKEKVRNLVDAIVKTT